MSPREAGPVRRLWEAMREQRRLLVAAGLLGALASASAVALLGASGWLISRAAEAPPVLQLTVAAVMVRAFALGRAVFRYGERLIGHDAAFRGLTGLRVRVYEGLERIAPRGPFSGGDLLSRLVGDIDAALDLPLRIVLPWAQAILVAAGTVAFVAVLLPADGLVLGIAAVAALALAPWAAARLAQRFEHRIAPERGALSATVITALTASADLAAMRRTGDATREAARRDAVLTRAVGREATGIGLAAAIDTAICGLAVIAALAISVPAVTEGRLAPVWLAVAVLLPIALIDTVSGLPASALALQRLHGSAARVMEIIDARARPEVPARPVPVPDGALGIAIRGLRAGWSAVPVLDGIDLDLAPGSRTAIVGPSGCGKSTLAAVLACFLEYDGSVRLGGIELRDADPEDVRRHCAVMTQRAHLFDTTIAENVRLGRPGIDDERLHEALDRAGLGAWIAELPEGTGTPVGAFGATVSGGQAQRIALARALVAPTPVVVLDEPTEHLDPVTAAQVQASIDLAFAGSTLVQVTHRLSMIRDDDRVVVLDGGRIIEQGTRRELASARGWFAAQLERERQDDRMRSLIEALPIGIGTQVPPVTAG